MLYGILAALLTSVADVSFKKSNVITERIFSGVMFQYVWSMLFFLVLIVLAFGMMLYGVSIFEGEITFLLVGLFFLESFIGIFGGLLYQYAYQKEKISVLSPYAQFETIITILIGFLVFSSSSLTTFIFALLAGVILFLGSIDFKNFRFSGPCIAMIAAGILTAIQNNILAYILVSLLPIDTLVYSGIVSIVLLFGLVFFRAESKKAGTLNAQAGRFLLFASSLRVIIYLISFLLVAEFGIVQATLLGMLTLVANIVFAYIFLHEKPGMKEIIITLLVITCVCIGSYF